MLMNSYIRLAIASTMAAIATGILYLLDKKTAFGKISEKSKQVIYGVIFGILAIMGTEWGIPINGAQVNCRDAAVITAGLMFGAPAGIIAGTIGALERWFAVAWGIGTFTRVACTVATFVAGLYAAVLRKHLFEDKKPGIFLAFFIGVVIEVFHLTMVFITHMAEPYAAIAVIKTCTFPMLIANGFSIMLAAIVITLLSGALNGRREKSQARISQTVQRWLFITVFFAFIVTSVFVFDLQNRIAVAQTTTLLDLALEDTAADIVDASDRKLLEITDRIAEASKTADLKTIAEEYGVAEVSRFDKSGIVIDSSVPDNIGLNAGDYKDSAEFLRLLGEQKHLVQGYRPNATDSSVVRKYAGVETDDGFLQVGYDDVQLQKQIDTEVINITKNRHVGQTGYIIIVNKNGDLISSPPSITSESLRSDGSVVGEISEKTTVKMSINGEMNYCRHIVNEGYYIISVLPAEEAVALRDTAIYVNSFLEILVFAVLFILIYTLIKRVVVNQIKSINNSLARITGGDLNEVVNVRTNAEFASLSDDINTTVNTLKRYIAEASARIDAELEFAKNIQTSALPSKFPPYPKRKDFDIYATMEPAKEVGGDFYDLYMTGSDTLHFLVADVSGKGIPAAMFMMRAKTELKTLTESEFPLNDVFTNGNRALCEGNDAGMFVTAWQGSIDLTSGQVKYANAGHNPPLVRHADGKFEYLRSRAGFVLAGMDSVKYKTQELQLVPGDIVYLYTDGVTEATNSENVLYGEERLLEAINSREFESMEELCGHIKSDVDAFVGEAPQFDDITMLALKYIGTPPAPSIHFDEAKIEDIPAITQFIETELEKIDCPMKAVIQLSIAIDEICSNIIKYAYPGKHGPMTVKFITKDDPHTVYINFEDEGIPYNPLVKEDPDITLSAEERSIGGLGIYMVKKTMDNMKYRYEGGKNSLTIKKTF